MSADAKLSFVEPWRAGKRIGVGSSALLETAEWLKQRLRTLRIQEPPNSRLTRARALISDVQGNSLQLRPDDLGLVGRVSDAQRTLMEFYMILRALDSRPAAFTPLVREKIEQILGGAEVEAHDARTHHRDVQFELFIYALFLMGGTTVHFAEPDLQFRYGTQEVGIAAKRVSSPRKLARRVMVAAQQIERGSGDGFIAVNLDRFVIGMGGATDAAEVEERGREFNRRVAALHALSLRFANRPRILGVMGFGYDYHWDFSRDTPQFYGSFFRQVVRFSETKEDVELARLFFAGLAARIENALGEM